MGTILTIKVDSLSHFIQLIEDCDDIELVQSDISIQSQRLNAISNWMLGKGYVDEFIQDCPRAAHWFDEHERYRDL